MKHFSTIFIIFLCLWGITGCDKLVIKDEVSPKWGLGKLANATAKRNISDCCLTFTLRTYFSQGDPQISSPAFQTSLLNSAFDLWALAIDKSFIYVAPNNKADVIFQFASPEQVAFTPDTIYTGWLPQPVESLVAISKNPNGTIILSLNDNHYWTPNELIHVFLYQIGAILGVPASNNPASIMYPYMGENPSIDIEFATSFTLQQLYENAVCDTWQPVEKLPFTAQGNYATFSIGLKGYVCLIDQNQLWEFDPRSMPQWTKKNPPATFQTIQTTFSANNKGYILTPNLLWEYDPANDRWNEYPTKLPFKATGRVVSMAIKEVRNDLKERGYVFFTETIANNTQLHCWEFNPTVETWTQKSSYKLSANASFEQASLSLNTFSIGLFLLPKQSLVLQYHFYNDNWSVRTPFPGFQTQQFPLMAWSLRRRTYLFTNNSELWQYAYAEWGQNTPPPFASKDIVFDFSFPCRGYVATKNGDFWAYAP
jgi:hypothetical protein